MHETLSESSLGGEKNRICIPNGPKPNSTQGCKILVQAIIKMPQFILRTYLHSMELLMNRVLYVVAAIGSLVKRTRR